MSVGIGFKWDRFGLVTFGIVGGKSFVLARLPIPIQKGRGLLESQEPNGENHPPAGYFDPHGKGRPRPTNPGKDVVKMGGRSFRSDGHLLNREASGVEMLLQVHAEKHNSVSLPSQGFRSYCSLLASGQDARMGWSRVDAFHKALKAYQERTGKTQTQVADDLETSYGTLRFWLSGTRPPKLANLQRASALFGCSVTEFLDDPGGEMAGHDVSGLSEGRQPESFPLDGW